MSRIPGLRSLDWLIRLHDRGRTVVPVLTGRRTGVYLLGPDANAFVFAHDDHFRFREAFAGLIPVDGETSVIVSDGGDHTRRRGLVRPGLTHRQVGRYLDTMVRCADEALDTVTPGEPFDAYQLLRAAIRRSTMLSLFGDGIGSRAHEVGEMLQPLLDLIDRLPDVVDVHRRLRTPLWRRAMRARAQVDEFVYAEIARERAGSGDSGRVLSTLVHGRDGTGSGLSDEEVRDQAVTLIAAGYETTSAAMGWTLFGLGSRPDLLGAAREEALAIDDVTSEKVADLRVLQAIVSESLRLWPPAAISARYVAEELEYAGRRLRPGTFLLYSPYVTHRSAQVYADPLAFRPERWLEAPRRSATEYLPFGGGSHRCIGSTLATIELTVMLSRLVRRGEFELVGAPPRATSYAAMRPRDGLRVRLSGD